MNLGHIAAVIGEVRCEITPPFGVDLVWDPVASLAVARATGACFVREVFTGTPFDTGQLSAAKTAVPQPPVLANTGVTAETVHEVLAVADGAIVGTDLKRGGVTWDPVDPARAARLMEAARRARESVVVG